MKARIILLVMLLSLSANAATNWFYLPINVGGQIGPAGTNLFGTNLIAGIGITFTRGTNGEITINGGAGVTNFQDIVVTNRLRGTNYDYTLGTNRPSSIMSWEMFTNLMVKFTNSLASQTYVQMLTNNSMYVNGQLTASGVIVANDGLNVSGDSVAVNNGLNVSGGLVIQGLTGLKLLALDSGGNAISSAYYDTDIDAIIAGLGNTNLYVLNNAGKGTNNTFYSPTNTAQASNQVVATFKGVNGQTNNLLEWGTNNASGNMVRQGVIDHNGNVGFGTNAPAQALHLIGNMQTEGNGLFDGYFATTNCLILTNIAGHKWQIDNLAGGGGFTLNFTFDGGAIATLNNAANFNVSTISINGSTLSDISRNVKSTTITNSGSSMFTGSLTNRSTIYAPTNTAPFITSDNPTNSYTTGTVYFNQAQRSILVGAAVLNGGVSGSANITLNYTNEGVGYQLPMQTGAGVATTDIFPFCVPLSTNASFKFVSTMGTGATGSLTNVVLWLK